MGKLTVLSIFISICLVVAVDFQMKSVPHPRKFTVNANKPTGHINTSNLGKVVQLRAIKVEAKKSNRNTIVILGGGCCMHSEPTLKYMQNLKGKDSIVLYAGTSQDETLVRRVYKIPQTVRTKGLDFEDIASLGREWAPSVFIIDQSAKLTWIQKDAGELPQ